MKRNDAVPLNAACQTAFILKVTAGSRSSLHLDQLDAPPAAKLTRRQVWMLLPGETVAPVQ